MICQWKFLADQVAVGSAGNMLKRYSCIADS